MHTTTIVAAILSSSSVQTTALENLELWRGLRVGMTKEEAKAVLPRNEIDLLPDCRIIASQRFEKGKLTAVTLSPKWMISKNNCVRPIAITLNEKYGEPQRGVDNLPGNQFQAAKVYDVFSWQSQKLQVIFREQVGGQSWSLTYRPVQSVAPEKRIEGL